MAHIPHQGSMCLLDEVTHWDTERICCRSSNHRAADNPLRMHGRLGILCGVEYAAQAMAVHGALVSAALVRTDTTAGTATNAGSAQRPTADAAVSGTATAGAAMGAAATDMAADIATTGLSGTAIAAAAMAGATVTNAVAPNTTSAQPPAAGFLAALRGVTAHVSRLDDVPGDLIVAAVRVAGDQASALYKFEVRSAVGCLLSGRATVVLDAHGWLR